MSRHCSDCGMTHMFPHRQAVPREEEERWAIAAALPLVALSAFIVAVGVYALLIALLLGGR